MLIHVKTMSRCLVVAGFLFAYFANAQDVDEINGGEVVSLNCARCHNARSIHEFTPEEWSVVLPHMRVRAHLTGAETRAVVDFFQKSWEATRVSGADYPAEELMTKYSCLSCHSFNGVGGTVAINLDDVITRQGEDFFRKKLRNPQFNNSATPMPKMNILEAEIESLIEYLKNS